MDDPHTHRHPGRESHWYPLISSTSVPTDRPDPPRLFGVPLMRTGGHGVSLGQSRKHSSLHRQMMHRITHTRGDTNPSLRPHRRRQRSTGRNESRPSFTKNSPGGSTTVKGHGLPHPHARVYSSSGDLELSFSPWTTTTARATRRRGYRRVGQSTSEGSGGRTGLGPRSLVESLGPTPIRARTKDNSTKGSLKVCR